MLNLILVSISFHVANAVVCMDYNQYAYPEPNTTCEGDLCFAVRSGKGIPNFMGCLSGVPKPKYGCSLNYYDQIACYCDTDMCNNDSIFSSNFTILPVIECKKVSQREYVAAACNLCQRRVEYEDKNVPPLKEFVECSSDGESGEYIFKVSIWNRAERLLHNFYPDACYNTTMNPHHYTVYCRCSQKNCNTPEADIPFPIAPPTVSCYTGGMDYHLNSPEYASSQIDYNEQIKNDSFSDIGLSCRGHFCFVARLEEREYLYEGTEYYKGCISANEQGDHRIQLGYLLLNNVHWYICNTDFCNSDIQNALEEARNATAVKDNISICQNTVFNILFVSLYSFMIKR